MDIRRLNHFIALAEEGRFAAAAERVHLSQAAFSRSIQALEGRLGIRLVDRNPEGVSLTPTGAAVLERARTLVFDSDCMVRDVKLLKSGDIGELTVGSAPIPTATLLPPLAVRLQRERPGVSLRLRLGNLMQLLPLLEAQQLDFCFGDPRLLAPSQRLAMKRIVKIHGGLFCRKNHPLARRKKLDAAAVRQYGVGAFTMSPELLTPIARGLGFSNAMNFPMALLCDDVGLLATTAAQTDLLVMLPDATAAAHPQLQRLPWSEAHLHFADVHAIWMAGRTLSPAAHFAIEAAKATRS